jgi:hypothetical protein
VEQDSATLGYSHEVRVALNGDHSSIVKYCSNEDSNYRMVSEHLALLVREYTARKAAERDEAITNPLIM